MKSLHAVAGELRAIGREVLEIADHPSVASERDALVRIGMHIQGVAVEADLAAIRLAEGRRLGPRLLRRLMALV